MFWVCFLEVFGCLGTNGVFKGGAIPNLSYSFLTNPKAPCRKRYSWDTPLLIGSIPTWKLIIKLNHSWRLKRQSHGWYSLKNKITYQKPTHFNHIYRIVFPFKRYDMMIWTKTKHQQKPPEPTGGVFPHRTKEPRCVHPPRLRHDLALRPGLRVVGNVGDAWWFGWIRGAN